MKKKNLNVHTIFYKSLLLLSLCISFSFPLVGHTKEKILIDPSLDERYLPAVEVLSIWGEETDLKPEKAPYANYNAPQGGALKLSAVGTFDNFNPFAKRGSVASYSYLTYETLATSGYTDSLTMQGVLAKNFRIAKDKFSILINLHEDALFSDGSPLTAEDVVYSFNALVNEANPFYRTYYEQVKSVEVLGKHSFIFHFTTNQNKELPIIVCQLPVLSAKWWKGRNVGEPQVEKIVGSGPYTIKFFDMGKRVVYERNKNWWGNDKATNQGLYNFETVEIDYYRDAAIAREAFLAGEVDYFSENTMKNWVNAYNVPAVLENKIIKREQPIKPIGGTGLYLNARTRFLSDINVRKAMIALFDFEWTNRVLFYNAYSRFSNFFLEDLKAQSLPTEDELAILNKWKDKLNPEIFGPLPTIPITDATGRNDDGFRKAYYLLKASGWNLIDGKMVNSKNEQLTLDMIVASQSIQRVYLPFQKSLERIGIKLNIQFVDTTQFIERARNYEYDMITLSVIPSSTPGNEQRSYWSSAASKAHGESNYAGVENEVIDEIIELLIMAKTRKEWVNYANVLDRLLQHGYYIIYPWESLSARYSWWANRIIPSPKDNKNGVDIMSWYASSENSNKAN